MSSGCSEPRLGGTPLSPGEGRGDFKVHPNVETRFASLPPFERFLILSILFILSKNSFWRNIDRMKNVRNDLQSSVTIKSSVVEILFGCGFAGLCPPWL